MIKRTKQNLKKYEYNYQSEISELNSFAKYIGYYLEKQNNKNNIINQRVWANVLNRWSLFFSTYSIPEERAEDFLKAKVNTYFLLLLWNDSKWTRKHCKDGLIS